MNLYTPAYYEQFACIASRCPDSCCKDWAVDIDAATAAYYRSLPGELGDRLRAVLQDTEDGTCMTIENGRCPMWRADGLCRIQAELGHDALSHTCRTFPRLRHDYGDFAELGLELSCPEAARLILTQPADMLCTQVPGGETPDYDREAMKILLRSRTVALEFLETSPYSVPDTLAILLLYAHSVQSELDGGAPAVLCPEEDLADARHYAAADASASLEDFFLQLEILTPAWKRRLETVSCPCGGLQEMELCALYFDDAAIHSPWPDQYKALARYFFMRYWLQAVSDYELIGRVKFTVTACLLIHRLGGDLVATAQAFSKEIENDPDNVEAILDGAYTSPTLTDANLLHHLLPPPASPR